MRLLDQRRFLPLISGPSAAVSLPISGSAEAAKVHPRGEETCVPEELGEDHDPPAGGGGAGSVGRRSRPTASAASVRSGEPSSCGWEHFQPSWPGTGYR